MASLAQRLTAKLPMRARQRLAVCLAFAVAAVPSGSWAQTVIGRSVVDGQPVELLDNQTWRFAGSNNAVGAEGCTLIRQPISFCAAGSLWRRLPPTGDPNIAAAFILNDFTYGMLIIEQVGLNRGMNMAALRRIVLQNAATFVGGSAADIPVLDTFPTTIDSISAETIIYAAQIEGLDFVYANSLIVENGFSAQIVTYSVGDSFSAEHSEAHADFSSRVRIAE